MKPARIEALADGVFAIVMTLLILEIGVPVVHESSHMNQDLVMGLAALWPKLVSFVASFLVLGIYWGGHHLIFGQVKRITFHYMWLNLLFLLAVTFIPFSTALLGEYPFQPIAQIIYGLNLIIAGLLLHAVWRVALRIDLVDHAVISHEMRRNARNKILLPSLIYAIGIALVFWNPTISIAAFILGPILYLLPVDTRLWKLITHS